MDITLKKMIILEYKDCRIFPTHQSKYKVLTPPFKISMKERMCIIKKINHPGSGNT